MSWLRRDSRVGLSLVACSIAFNAVLLAPEIRIGRVPLNDAVFHLAAAERLGASFGRDEPFLDPWVSEWSLGYPVWRSYQPLPHVLAAAALRIAEPLTDHATAFATLQYLLMVFFPASVYAGARMLGLAPVASGLASMLVLAPGGTGEFDRYGLGYGASTWRGSGLFTQLVAFHGLALTVGLLARALETGRRQGLASAMLALTSLSHIVFGYAAFLTAPLLAFAGPSRDRGGRSFRLVTMLLTATLLLAWFLVPLAIGKGEAHRSRWEPEFKWNSFGAPLILAELFSGRLLDHGRAPVLSLLVLLGALMAGRELRNPLPRLLLALTSLWLGLFFGRETWGHLLLLVGIPSEFHLHRLQAVFEWSAVLLAAWGAERAIRAVRGFSPGLGLGAVGVIALLLVAAGRERASYLREGARWGEDNLAQFEAQRPQLEAALTEVHDILAERPGRASAGLAAHWGKEFKVGAVPFYAFLTREHIDQASFLYHSMSKASDIMVLRTEENPAQAVAFGVRAVVAPATREMPPFFRRRAVHGPFAVYEASPEGYFGVADVGGCYRGPPATHYEPSAAWLASPLLPAGVVVALDGCGDEMAVPSVGRWEPLPPLDLTLLSPRGSVLAETKRDEIYQARLSMLRPSYAFLKIGWHPDLEGTVDGEPAPVLHVTPGFVAVAVPRGEHDVVVRFRPGRLKLVLLFLGVGTFALAWGFLRAGRRERLERAWDESLSRRVALRVGPRCAAVFAFGALAILALRPLFQGRLIAGHDALAYPPRLVEMARVLADGHVPPVWAPDLGAGHGQPLFAFAPPLLYLVALVFRAVGAGIADSIQFALVVLHAAGAGAIYGIGRRASCSRLASLAASAAWLFAPYTALDLYVRSAFAESAAVAVAPLALLAVLRALDRPSLARVAMGGVMVALIPLAHNVGALLLVPALGALVLVRSAGRRWAFARLAAGAGAIASGLGLSLFFWLPALGEMRFVQADLLREGLLDWRQHAILPSQLLFSPWGHGLSLLGPDDGMGFSLGLPHLALAAAGTVLVWRSRDPDRRAEAATFAALAVAGALLSTTWAEPVWSRAKLLQYLAYPWRSLLLPGLFLPVLALFAFEGLGRKAAAAVAGVLIAMNVAHTEPRGYLSFDDEYYTPAAIAEKAMTTTTREEYTPRWVESRPVATSSRLSSKDPSLDLLDQRISSVKQEFRVRAGGPVEVEAATFYYPGWTVEVDGVATASVPVRGRGTIGFRLPPGEHRVVLELRPTALRRAATLLSLVTALVLAAGGIAGRLRDRARS